MYLHEHCEANILGVLPIVAGIVAGVVAVSPPPARPPCITVAIREDVCDEIKDSYQ